MVLALELGPCPRGVAELIDKLRHVLNTNNKYQVEGKDCQTDTNEEVGVISKGEAGLFAVRSEKALWRKRSWFWNKP